MPFDNRGRVNLYRCDRCNESIVTVDRDLGVTPYLLRCVVTNGCDGLMRSEFYRIDQSLPPTWAWHTQAGTEVLKLRRIEQ